MTGKYKKLHEQLIKDNDAGWDEYRNKTYEGEDPVHPIIRDELEAGVLGLETWLFDEIESAIFRLQRLSINYYSGATGQTETGRLIDKLYDIHFNKGGKV